MSREQIEHFGTRVKSYPEGNKLTRDNFVSEQNKTKGFENWYTEDALENHMDELMKPYIANAMLSYDINMRYLDALDRKCFEGALKLLRVHFQMKEVTNLKDYGGIPGVYVMVFDEHKQFYIGKSKDITKRIYTHWTHFPEIWRLVFGDVCKSLLPIDSFRALDTTRIYFKRCYIPEYTKRPVDEFLYRLENEFTQYVVDMKLGKYMTNRLMGGDVFHNDIWRPDDVDRLAKVVTDADIKAAREINSMFRDIGKYSKPDDLRR